MRGFTRPAFILAVCLLIVLPPVGRATSAAQQIGSDPPISSYDDRMPHQGQMTDVSLAQIDSQIAANTLRPADLAVYYGWPSLVNGNFQNNAAAAAVFGQYQMVVFGEGVEESTHGDHANTIEIIQILRQNYGTRAFGYIDATRWETTWTHTGSSPVDWEAHLDMWVAMGVDGVFVDRFGYDWSLDDQEFITRVIQNSILDAIHSRSLSAFVNGWFVDHVFGSDPDPGFPWGNPTSIPSHMLSTDLYLLESFTIIEGNYDVCDQPYGDSWIDKADKAFQYHLIFGSEMWTLTTANRLTLASLAAISDEVDPRLSYAWHATALYGFQGFGWAEPYFSAGGAFQNLLPWRSRPSPNPPVGTGTQFQNDVQHLDTLHARDTDVGQFRVVCGPGDTRSAEFVAWAVTPVLDIALDGNQVRLNWLHQAANQTYQIWRGTDLPYFDPGTGQGTQIATVAADGATHDQELDYLDDGTTPLPIVEVIGDVTHQYFWIVRGANDNGVSDNSNRVGEFDFALVAGQ